jgi:hypothetical protein
MMLSLAQYRFTTRSASAVTCSGRISDGKLPKNTRPFGPISSLHAASNSSTAARLGSSLWLPYDSDVGVMNRTSRSPASRIRRTCQRTFSTDRCRKRAENMNGVWQKRHAYTQPRVISIGLYLPQRSEKARYASSGRRSARAGRAGEPRWKSPGTPAGSPPASTNRSSVASPSPTAATSQPASSVCAGSAVACTPPATCTTRGESTRDRISPSSTASAAASGE